MLAVALRVTGDHTMSEEVVQNVFAILARKASTLARLPQLPDEEIGSVIGALTDHEATLSARRRIGRFLLVLSAVAGTVRRLMSSLYEASTTPV